MAEQQQEDLNAPSDMKEQIDEKQGSILMGIIKQLRIGMDLSRVTLPTFILEPRSFLERMSDFMIHNDLLMGCVPRHASVGRPVGRQCGCGTVHALGCTGRRSFAGLTGVLLPGACVCVCVVRR